MDTPFRHIKLPFDSGISKFSTEPIVSDSVNYFVTKEEQNQIIATLRAYVKKKGSCDYIQPFERKLRGVGLERILCIENEDQTSWKMIFEYELEGKQNIKL